MSEKDDALQRRLQMIASALGISVADLSDGSFELFDGSGECLRLWGQIATEDGRRRALDCLRKEIDRQV